ncbi:hypothetical protein C8R45DRAFT_938734 [Mycena sanguinolenta]|nr:hypothetical protein C8R45DRAFT_938734 [Mycena sanguinolenta]
MIASTPSTHRTAYSFLSREDLPLEMNNARVVPADAEFSLVARRSFGSVIRTAHPSYSQRTSSMHKTGKLAMFYSDELESVRVHFETRIGSESNMQVLRSICGSSFNLLSLPLSAVPRPCLARGPAVSHSFMRRRKNRKFTHPNHSLGPPLHLAPARTSLFLGRPASFVCVWLRLQYVFQAQNSKEKVEVVWMALTRFSGKLIIDFMLPKFNVCVTLFMKLRVSVCPKPLNSAISVYISAHRFNVGLLYLFKKNLFKKAV